MHDVAVVTHAAAAGVGVTVYEPIGTPPVSAGAVHDTVTCVLPGAPDTPVAFPGATAA